MMTINIEQIGIKSFDSPSLQTPRATPEEEDDTEEDEMGRRSVYEDFRNFANLKKFFTQCQCLSVLSRRRFKNENMIVLSLIQVLCGLAAIIFSSIAINKGVFLYKMATGLWAGFIMIATGIHGLLTAVRTQVCTLISLLVWSVLSSLTSMLLICVSIAGLIEDNEKIQKFEASQGPTIYLTNQKMFFTSPVRFNQIILHILLLVVGCLEASVGFSTAIFCCKTLCPLRNNSIKSSYANFLMAIPDMDSSSNENQEEVEALPYLYSNVTSFMPKCPENAVVLTHYDASNSGAMCAAKATTAYLNHLIHQKRSQTTIFRNPSLESLFSLPKGLKFPNYWRYQSTTHRPFPGGKMKILTCRRKNIETLSRLLKESKETNLIYVMPSPNRDQPPTLFPPFPPTYTKSSRLAREKLRLTMNSSNYGQNVNFGQLLHSLNQISSRHYSTTSQGNLPRRRLRRGNHETNDYRQRSHSSRRQPSSSLYQINGDRILHPVLIIQRPEKEPPSYPFIDDQLTKSFGPDDDLVIIRRNISADDLPAYFDGLDLPV